MKNSPPTNEHEQHFRTEHLKADLKGRSVRGGAVTLFAQVCKFVLQLGSTVILARLLTPQDYGLIGMVAAVTGFVSLFRDMGLSMATIQKAEINHRQVSTLFWVNLGISVVTMLVTMAIAPAIALFYGEPRLTLITIVSAIGFIFGGLSVQHYALLNRQMRFTALALNEITAMLLGITTGIVLAWYGMSYWALVILQLVSTLCATIGVWLLCNWRPGLPSLHSGIREMLTFGGNLTGFNILNYFARNFDNVLVGRYLGAGQLGLYAKAYQLLLLPIQQINGPITSVAIPALSRLQNEPEKFCAYYYKSIQMIVTLGMPLVTFLCVVADKLVPTLLGAQWTDAVIIFRVLSLAAFLGTFNVASGWVYISLGQTARQLRWEVFASTVMLIGFVIGIQWGVIGIAASFSITSLLVRYPAYVYCFKFTPLKVNTLFGVLWKPAIASLTAGVILFAINTYFSFNVNAIISLIISSCLYFLLYIACWLLLPNGRQTLYNMLQTIGKLKQKSP